MAKRKSDEVFPEKDVEGNESRKQVRSEKHDDKKNIGLGSIVASHYNKMEEKGLTERSKSRIFYMRNFNNWIKSFFLNKHLNMIRQNQSQDYQITAIDLGCGKGGDILKWCKGNVHHVVFADIAGTSVSQCKDRYLLRNTSQSFSAEFIVADCTKVPIKNHFSDPELKADIVSCQFSFHYCFESLSQAETMLRNISDSLKTGGYFIATFPESYEIMARLKRDGDGFSFGNEVYRIEFPQDRPEKPPLFGDKYNFYLEGVVDCPEFLVHFPTLVRLCRKYGLEPSYKKRFSDVYEDARHDQEAKRLLFKMQAVELYSPYKETELVSSSPNEYDHCKSFLEKNNCKEAKTLSKSEWEAITLYLACAFRKIR